MKQKERARIQQLVNDLDKRIDFVPEAVVKEACEQTVLFRDAISLRLIAMEGRQKAKSASERTAADARVRLRDQYKLSGDKITESGLDAACTLDPTCRLANDELNEWEGIEEMAKLMLEVFRMRRDCLRMVAELAGTEMAVARGHAAGQEQLGQLRSQMKKRYPGGK